MGHNTILTSPLVFCVFAGITVLLFLVFREIVTWYWKINEIVTLLSKIEKHLDPHGED
jgi:hypothetical protein